MRRKNVLWTALNGSSTRNHREWHSPSLANLIMQVATQALRPRCWLRRPHITLARPDPHPHSVWQISNKLITPRALHSLYAACACKHELVDSISSSGDPPRRPKQPTPRPACAIHHVPGWLTYDKVPHHKE